MGWFPTTRDNSSNGWRFDIVGLLAVIGEASIEFCVPAITSLQLSYVPRLLPAPQALLKTERPTQLPSKKNVTVCSVAVGVRVEELNYYPNIFHMIDDVADYEFQEWTIEYSEKAPKNMDARFASRSVMAVKTYKIRDKDQAIEAAEHDPAGDEAGVPYYNTPVFTAERAIHIRMGTFNPVNLISAFSIALTIGLLVWAAWIHDGVACVAIGVISLSTSIACLANSWRPQIIERPSSPSRPPGDVIIKTSGGALIVVHCSDEIVRELYFGAEKCDYVVPRRYWSILISISTIMLMVAVVLLGNCSWTMQAAVGVAYIILNGIYWILSVFRAPYSPLFTILEERYDIKKSSKQDVVLESEKTRRGVVKTLANKALLVDQHYNRPSYTRTLAYAIQATQDTRWVWETKAAPDTKAWREWVELAGINMNDPAWNPVSAKDECMGRNANATMQARQAEAMASAVVTPGQPTQNLAVRPQIGPSQTVSP